MTTDKNSQISKFYKRSLKERREILKSWMNDPAELDQTLDQGLTTAQADPMIENVIGIYSLPFGIATNFLINGKDYLIPMVIEEPSVVAAASNAAKLIRAGGGFTTRSDEPIMIGQIQILDVPDINKAIERIKTAEKQLMAMVDAIAGSIVKRGGGARGIETRVIPNTLNGDLLIVHLLYDTRDAMGANAINTAVEHIAPEIETLTSGRVNLKILSNLSDRRKAYAEGIVPAGELAQEKENLTGVQVVDSIVEASVFAECDPYRATTHNKGIMNGIDAVVMATGNDWRAIEAGAHAYAARHGHYTSLTQWRKTENGDLQGRIELPMAIGTVGGATRVHPTAQLAMKILGIDAARELSEVIAAVGLAQNLAAIRALATTGIQHGHMRMHARQLAIAAGASPEMIGRVVEAMIKANNIRLEYAKTLVAQGEQSG
ncbi:MAG: hydroxymethylglutaryl-CoA reductase, degradative [Anaerolineae bacterium]|jgi:hydroxymethylglutaryl-CoA reductase|nr:hydroxymethylglutaryl-CoA reductase, degradative [Anaerolineae bacterium]